MKERAVGGSALKSGMVALLLLATCLASAAHTKRPPRR